MSDPWTWSMMMPPMAALSENTLHMTQTICNALWGHQLSFHGFTIGDDPVDFASLWPDKKTLVETYRDASLERASYELCKLLLATKSVKSLKALLEEKVLMVNHNFRNGGVTLAHLACVLGCGEAIQVLKDHGSGSSAIWNAKDDEDHTAIDVCFSQEIRRYLPNRPLFRKKITTGLPLKSDDRDRIFQLAAQADAFYKVVVQLQIYLFDVNKDRNKEGDLLIHVAVKGGLPFLPLLFVLVNQFKADVTPRDGEGLTPLCLAAKLGEEKVAEVLVCVFGADMNVAVQDRKWTPLHFAVDNKHARIVSMLVRRGADVECEDKNRCVPAFLAKRKRAPECRQIITQHIRERTELLGRQAADGTLRVSLLYPSDSCLVTAKGRTLLMLATMNNRTELVRQLVKMHNRPLDFKEMQCCSTVDTMESTITSTSAIGPERYPEETYALKTAVHHAAEKGYVNCLKLLLDAGAHPALTDANCWLPLHYACDSGHIDCVKAILAYPNHLGLSGLRPAIDLAEGNKNKEIVAVLREAFDRRQKELVKPILFEVACSGNKDLLYQILENGDDVNPINESNDWPLLLAAGFGYIDVVTQLFEFGGHVTHHHKISRSTPLHVAARGGHTPVVRYLLKFYRHLSPSSTPPTSTASATPPIPKSGEEENGLDINETNAAGATPLELAASQGHLEVVRLLLDHGACTTLPDSNGRLISCASFAGTQFIIETNRKERLRRILTALESRMPLREFQKIWQGPSDFNLRRDNGDTILMVAAKHTSPDIIQFLLQSASSCKPGMLVSPPGQLLPLNAMGQHQNGFPTAVHLPMNSSSSNEDSDGSDRSLPLEFSIPDVPPPPRNLDTMSLQVVPNDGNRPRPHPTNPFDSDNSLERPLTAVPNVMTVRHRQRKSESALRRRQKPHRQRGAGGLSPHSHSSTTTTTSSEDEKVGTMLNGIAEEEEGTMDSTGPHISIIRLTNPHDGQTALHRAADFNQPENVSILIKADPECANTKDKNGNTPLHLACRKAHKKTIKTMLSLDRIDCSIRNSFMELPEDGCLKSGLRKAVCKRREQQQKARITKEFPSPPGIPKKGKKPLGGLAASSGPVNSEELPSALFGTGSQQGNTPESVLSMSGFNREMERLQCELRNKKDGSSS